MAQLFVGRAVAAYAAHMLRCPFLFILFRLSYSFCYHESQIHTHQETTFIRDDS